MLRDFAATDFETTNEQLSNVCNINNLVVRNGIICDKFYSLIQPEPNYYCHSNSNIHGLTSEDTDNAAIFPKAWKEIEPLIEGFPLVAHNKGFDEACTEIALQY